MSLCYRHTGIRVRCRKGRVRQGVNFVRKICESSKRKEIYACQYELLRLVETVCSDGFL